MVRRSLLLILGLVSVVCADTGFKDTIQVTETDNSPKCQVGQIKFTAGTVTCNGQSATVISGGSGGSSSLEVMGAGLRVTSPTVTASFLAGSNITITTAAVGGTTAQITISATGGGNFALNASSQAALTTSATLATDTNLIYSQSGSTITIGVDTQGSCAAGTAGTNGFAYKQTITIDHTKVPNTDQIDYPVLVSLQDLSLATAQYGGYMKDGNAYDHIYSTSSDCAFQTYWSTKTYDASLGKIIDYVLVSTLSHTVDTPITMCWGKTGISTFQSISTRTWNQNYIGVFPLGRGAGVSTDDLTGNGLNATNSGAVGGPGLLGYGAHFNGSNQSMSAGANTDFNITSTGTVEVLYYVDPTNGTGFQTMVAKGNLTTDRNGFLFADYLGGGTHWLELDSGSASQQVQGTITNSTATWHYGVMNWNGTTLKAYLDGVLDKSIGQTVVPLNTVTTLKIGVDDGGTPTYWFGGTMQELRISSAILTADWIATSSNNYKSLSTFETLGGAYPSHCSNVMMLNSTQTVNATMTFGAPIHISSGITLSGSSGNSGQVLTSSGIGKAPVWQTVQFSSGLAGAIQIADGAGGFQGDSTTFAFNKTGFVGGPVVTLNNTTISGPATALIARSVANSEYSLYSSTLPLALASLVLSPNIVNLFGEHGQDIYLESAAPDGLPVSGNYVWRMGRDSHLLAPFIIDSKNGGKVLISIYGPEENPVTNKADERPHPSAAFEVRTSSFGVLLATMTTTQRNTIATPADRLMIQNVTTKMTDVYSNGAWDEIPSLASSPTWTGTHIFNSSMTYAGQVNISSSVLLTGASGTNGQVLTSGGANTVPTWTTVSGSGDNLGNGTGTYGVNTASGVFTYGVVAGSGTFSTTLSIPNGTAPSVTDSGQIGIDTSAGQLVAYDGATANVVGSSTKSFTVTISSGIGWSGLSIPIWRAPTNASVSITKILAESLGAATTVQYQLDERAFGSVNSAGSSIFSVPFSTACNTGNTTTSFADSSIASQASLVFTTPSTSAASAGTPSIMTFTVYYKEDRQ